MATTLQWGMQDIPPATDIADLQRALNDLGYSTVVDGYFGPQTRSAVRSVQQDNGLTVDGIVGPETAEVLGLGLDSGTPTSSTPSKTPVGAGRREMQGIGINRVDPARYGGWNGALGGCENDCDTMVEIARSEGYTILPQLKTASATSDAILDAIAAAATRMTAGDTFMVCYAGHGGQVPNVDADVDPEADAQDETWVCFDRQLVDDELWRAWQDFAPGVTIIVTSDSCHSGTVARQRRGPVDSDLDIQTQTYALKKAYYTDLSVPRPGLNDPPVASFPRPFPPGTSRSAPTNGGGSVATREMPLEANLRDVDARADLYAAVQLPGKVAVRNVVRCNVVTLSGCTDMQLSQEINGHGVFTTRLHGVWANNTWKGSYDSLIKTMAAQMGPTQTPVLGQYGPTADQVVAMTPFD